MDTGQAPSHHAAPASRRVRVAALAFAALLIPSLLVVAPGAALAVPGTCNGQVATVVGSDQSDFFITSQGDDVISLGGGNDVVFATRGNDTVCGGDGDDYLDGGAGSGDFVDGGPGFDTCTNAEVKLNCEA